MRRWVFTGRAKGDTHQAMYVCVYVQLCKLVVEWIDFDGCKVASVNFFERPLFTLLNIYLKLPPAFITCDVDYLKLNLEGRLIKKLNYMTDGINMYIVSLTTYAYVGCQHQHKALVNA